MDINVKIDLGTDTRATIDNLAGALLSLQDTKKTVKAYVKDKEEVEEIKKQENKDIAKKEEIKEYTVTYEEVKDYVKKLLSEEIQVNQIAEVMDKYNIRKVDECSQEQLEDLLNDLKKIDL